jgi:hypothetical protein
MGKPERTRPARTQPLAAPRALARSRAKKVSLTVDESVLRAMKHEAKRAGRTLSAEVSDALARELRRRRLQDLIAEYEEEHGLISADELARIQVEWQA